MIMPLLQKLICTDRKTDGRLDRRKNILTDGQTKRLHNAPRPRAGGELNVLFTGVVVRQGLLPLTSRRGVAVADRRRYEWGGGRGASWGSGPGLEWPGGCIVDG